MVFAALFWLQSTKTLLRPQVLGHPRDHEVRVRLLQPLGQLVGVRRGPVGGHRDDRRVDLHPLRATRLGVGREAVRRQLLAQHHRDPGALHHRRRRPRVQVQDEEVRAAHRAPGADGPLGHVQLERGQVGGPDERGEVVDHDVVDGLAVLAAPGHRQPHGPDPLRRAAGGVLREEPLAVHTVRVALEGDRPVAQMWQQDVGDAGVVVDDLALGEPGLGIEHLVEVGQRPAGAPRPRPPTADSPTSSPSGHHARSCGWQTCEGRRHDRAPAACGGPGPCVCLRRSAFHRATARARRRRARSAASSARRLALRAATTRRTR